MRTTLSCLSRQNKRSSFHTHTQLIQKLQDSNGLKSVLLSQSKILKSGFLKEIFVSNNLINSYVKFGEIDNARKVFDEMPERNVVSWTALMAGYTAAGEPESAIWMFTKMPRCAILPNAFTFSVVINACSVLADSEIGVKVHALVELHGYQRNVFVCSALIDMYGKLNDLDAARWVFESMGKRNVVSWTATIAGYAQNGRGYDSLELFNEFNRVESDRPNHFMLASVANACASLGFLVYGKVIHASVVKRGYEMNEVVTSALLDMYSKCGCIEESCKVFQGIQDPSVIPYTSMIVGAAKNGLGELSLALFNEMVAKRIRPNDVTYLGVLYACSHSGLVDEGLKHLNLMQTEHGILPDPKHYTCTVDMLGRSGRLDEAYRMAKSIKVERNQGAFLWGTLLSSSRLHGRLDIATEASKWLVEANLQVDAAFVSMSNAYVLAGNWDDAQSIRSKMKRFGVKKEPGCSWVEISDKVYVFYAGDLDSCARKTEVLSLLKELEQRMKERGYVGGSKGLVFVDVEEEAKEEIVMLHSERLALAFGLISLPNGVTVRIMKNLRMCRDCHEAFKLISGIVERDFIVRDVNRFHHFRNGSCSCRDYW